MNTLKKGGNMKIFKVSIALITAITIFSMMACDSCDLITESDPLKKIRAVGVEFETEYTRFERNSAAIRFKIEDARRKVEERLSEDDPYLSGIIDGWNEDWTDIIKRFNDLKKNYKEVNKRADNLFKAHRELSHSIKDKKLRQSELDKIREFELTYKESSLEALKKIDKIEKELQNGNDKIKVLVGMNFREQIAECILELKSISKNADGLLELIKELKKFEEDSKKLVDITQSVKPKLNKF